MADTTMTGLFGLSGDTWKGIGNAGEGLFGAVSSLFGGFAAQDVAAMQEGLFHEEADYLQLGQEFQENADFLKETALQRRAGMSIGATSAGAASAGLAQGGTVAALIREGVTQGAFEQGQMATQALSNYMNFQGQIDAANTEAAIAERQGENAALGGIAGAIGGVAKAGFALAGVL